MDSIQTNSKIRLWPPSKKTRIMMVERVTHNLSNHTTVTQKYGCLSKHNAEKNAKQIEQRAFDAANQRYEKEPDGDASSTVAYYLRKLAKLALEAVKRCPTTMADRQVLPIISDASDITLREAGNSFTRMTFCYKSFGFGTVNYVNYATAALDGSGLKLIDISKEEDIEIGVGSFVVLLKLLSGSLEELYLTNGAAAHELSPFTEKLKVFHFRQNTMGDEGALAISEVVNHSPLLEDFRCSSMGVGSEGGIALSEALERCAHLKKLDLRDNMFGVEAGVALGKAISQHANLTEAYLSYLNLEDVGVIALAKALKDSAPRLTVLEMAGNYITLTAVPTLAESLSGKKHLSKLNLSENKLNDEGAIYISKSLEGIAKLKELNMSSNAITWIGARVLAQMVVNKPSFQLLNVNRNFLSDEGIDELNLIFKNSPEKLGSLDKNEPEGGEDDQKVSKLEANLKKFCFMLTTMFDYRSRASM